MVRAPPGSPDRLHFTRRRNRARPDPRPGRPAGRRPPARRRRSHARRSCPPLPGCCRASRRRSSAPRGCQTRSSHRRRGSKPSSTTRRPHRRRSPRRRRTCPASRTTPSRWSRGSTRCWPTRALPSWRHCSTASTPGVSRAKRCCRPAAEPGRVTAIVRRSIAVGDLVDHLDVDSAAERTAAAGPLAARVERGWAEHRLERAAALLDRLDADASEERLAAVVALAERLEDESASGAWRHSRASSNAWTA